MALYGLYSECTKISFGEVINMIEDGYPIFNEKDWKAVPGAQAGALILDYGGFLRYS